MPDIKSAKIAILATNGFEQSELEQPRDALREAGAEVHVISPDGQGIRGWEGPDWCRTVEVDRKKKANKNACRKFNRRNVQG